MARARTLVLDTRVNVAGEEKLTGLSNRLEAAGTRIKSAFSPGNLLAVAGIGVGVSQITSFLGDAIDAASDLNETISKTGQVLGQDALPALEEWAEGAATAFGQSERTALDAAASFAIFGKSAGLVGDDLVGFSTGLTELSADFASFFNTSPEEAITAIGAALRGESEPIRRYGILLDDATLRQRAFSLGITDSIRDALTPQQRVLAAQAEIMAQSADAQGDFARTSGGLANQQRILQARLENVSAEVGEKLLPVMVEFVTFVSETGIPVMREFFDVLTSGSRDSADDIPILGQIEDFLNAVAESGVIAGDVIRFQENDVRRAMEATGQDYITLHTTIRDEVDETGRTWTEVTDSIIADSERSMENATRMATTFGDLPSHLSGAMHDTGEFGAAVDELVDGLPEGMQDAQDEAAAVVRKTPGVLANELRAAIEDYDEALAELTEVAVNSVSDLAERQKIEGILASQELTDALSSDSTRTRLLAQEFVSDLVSDYNLLAPGALGAGELVNPALSDGINSNIDVAVRAGEAVRDAAGNPLVDTQWAFEAGYQLPARFAEGMRLGAWLVYTEAVTMASAARGVLPDSEPKDPSSPLRGLIDSGRSVGERFAEGIRQSIPDVASASLAMGGAAVPGLTLPSVGTLSPIAGGVGGTVVNNFYLQWEGEPPRGGSTDEVIATLQRMVPLIAPLGSG